MQELLATGNQAKLALIAFLQVYLNGLSAHISGSATRVCSVRPQQRLLQGTASRLSTLTGDQRPLQPHYNSKHRLQKRQALGNI